SFAIDTYTLTVSLAGNGTGTVAKSPDQATYAWGTVVQLTATPGTGSNFTSWSGSVTGTTNPISVTMDGTKVVTATFTLKQWTVTASAGSNGTISPSGAVAVNNGTNQTFTITPALHYHVADVLVDGVSVGAVTTYAFSNVTANHTIAASFAIDTYTLTVSLAGNGTGSVAKSPNQASYGWGSVVQLTATPGTGSNFTAWSGAATGSTNPTTVTMTANQAVTATFTLKQWTLTASAGSNGTISPSGAVVVDHGTNQTFTITPALHYHVADVLVDGVSVGAVTSYTFTNVTANHTIAASFTIDTFTLSLTATAGGTAGKSPDQATYDYGTVVTLTASPSPGYAFWKWTGGAAGTSLVTTVSMTANQSVTANFVAATLPFTQDFASFPSGPLTAYQIGGVAADAKFDTFAVTGNSTASISGGRLLLSRGNGSSIASFTRLTDFANPAPTLLIYAFKLEKTAGTGTTAPCANLRVGSGFGAGAADEGSDANSYAKLGFILTNNSFRYQIRGPTAADTATAPNNAQITWVLNRTGGTASYLGPDGTTVTIGRDSTHVWVNAALRLRLAVATASVPMTDLKFSYFTNNGTLAFDDFSLTAPGQYTLNVATFGSGTVTTSPSTALYAQGSVATLTATPAVGWRLSAWSGDATGTANPLSVTLDANKAITATFVIQTFPITATAGPGGSIAPSGTTVVNYGSGQSYTITPALHYHVQDVKVDGVSVGAVSSYAFSNVTAAHTIDATFALTMHTVTASAGANGAIAPTGAVAVADGADQAFTITPALHYHILDVKVDGVSVGAVGSYTFTNVTADHTIQATFQSTTHTVTASAGANGAISPSGAVVVTDGAGQAFTITPALHYHVADVLVDGASVGAVASYTFTNVTADHAIAASFAIDTYTLTVSLAGNGTGSVARSPNQATYPWGSTVQLTATPGAGSNFTAWSGAASGSTNPVTVTMTANQAVTATFTLKQWTLTASAGSNGTISPSGAVVVDHGTNQTFTITPDLHYHVADVLVDGASVGAVTTYAFSNVTANHTVAASFTIDTYTLTVSLVGSGTVAKSPDLAAYGWGSTVQLTASPASGSAFAGWSGAATGTAVPVTLTMDADKAVTAHFTVAQVLQVTAATFPSYGSGLSPAWGDYDNDGDPDLPLMRNDGGGAFSEMPGLRTLLANGNYHGAAWCDFDRDGDLDLALQPYGGGAHARLFRNQGDGTFVDVAPSLGMDVAGFGATAVWGDFDGDGWPDLFMPYYSYTAPNRSYLWHNNGNGTFTDVAVASGVDLSNLPAGLNPEGACAGDFDDDGALDLYSAGHLFQNDGTGQFTDVRAAMGLPLVSDGAARWVDYDDDGDLDLSLRTASGPRLFRNDGATFTEVTSAAGLPAVGFMWGDSWADVDNDGDLDLYLSRLSQPARLYLNQGDGTFLMDPSFNLDDSSGLTAWADDDGDGDMDLHVEGTSRHRLENTMDSRAGFARSWLKVVVLDAQGKRTAYGATVRVRRVDGTSGQVQARVVDGGSGYLSQTEYAVHVGVAPAGRYALSVSYPGAGGQHVVVDQRQVSWLGNLMPGTLASPTITVFADGRATLGDWTITASATGGGTISPSGAVAVSEGTNRSFTITPDLHFHLVDVVVDGVSVGAVTTYTFSNVTTNHTIAASFAATLHGLTVTVVGNGSVTRSPNLTQYPEGSMVQLTAVPAPGFAFVRWDGDAAGATNPLDLTIDGDKAVTATFAIANIFQDAGVSFPPYTAGAVSPAWGDYDGDGDVDLPLYRNDGNVAFNDIAGFRDLLANQNYHGSSWCDYDRDGNLDLVLLPYAGEEDLAARAGGRATSVAVTGSDRARLLHNLGNGTFEDVAPALGMDVVGFGETAVWADFDGDGWPDLFMPYYGHVAPYHSFLWHNNGNGTFADVAAAAGADLANIPEALKPEGAHAVDVDGDGDLDLYCASHLFINDGTGHFTDQRAARGLPQVFDEGAMFVDYDDDGDFDLYLRTVAGPRLFRNDGGQFTEVTAAAGLTAVPLAWGDTWADVDNDGDLDLYLILPIYQSARLYLNQGDGTFVPDPTFNLYDSSGLNAWADIDRDGDLDLVIEAFNRHLVTNTIAQRPGIGGAGLRVVVLDAQGKRTQQGATLKLRRVDGPPGVVQTRAVDGGSGYLTQSEYAVHFGVDPAGTYALSVSFPGAGAQHVVVDQAQVPWLGSLVPGSLASHTLTVFKDGRATLGEWTLATSCGYGG
ncbi:MAG: hypothetical protein E6K81_09890, partial [Candidatus Eisenbacteria bacterium]